MTYILIFLTVIVSIACFNNRELSNRLSLKPNRVVHNREWYRVLTHIFVHGDVAHLAINMFVLLSFGLYVERLLKAYEQAGSITNSYLSYLLLYFGGAIAASVYDLIKQRNNPHYTSIGASGAVAAVVFTSIFFNPWNKLYLFAVVPIPGIVFGICYLAYSQYMGRRGADNINHQAHLYGALFGFCFPLLMDPNFFTIFWHNLMQF